MDGLEKKNAEDAAKWLLGLIFSAGIATFQNWRSKREQGKIFRSQIQEIHDVVKSQPAPVHEPAAGDQAADVPNPPLVSEDLRTIVQRIQQQLTDHQSRGDERHAANIARFESVEKSQHRFGEEMVDLRKYLRQNRGENRAMMKKILSKVSLLGSSAAPAVQDEDKSHDTETPA